MLSRACHRTAPAPPPTAVLCCSRSLLSPPRLLSLRKPTSNPLNHPEAASVCTQILLAYSLVVGGLAVVADDLEAADHLADGEEAQGLGEDDADRGELRGAEVADGVDGGLGRGDGAVLDGAEDLLVVGLEGGDGAASSQLLGRDWARRWLISRDGEMH